MAFSTSSDIYIKFIGSSDDITFKNEENNEYYTKVAANFSENSSESIKTSVTDISGQYIEELQNGYTSHKC